VKIFVVIPAYNESKHIGDVIGRIPPEVWRILVVDDCSTDGTGEVVESLADSRVELIRHERNRGVGGAMVTGYRRALEAGADVVVKIDGDGQMDPEEILRLVGPIRRGEADYSKGFRFHDSGNVRDMPRVRLAGNLGLSFLTKAASGYWDVFDPTSGFTAIHRLALSRINLDSLERGYFFETDMLIRLYRLQAVVRDVEISNRYADEKSHLSPFKMVFVFLPRLLGAMFRRVVRRYFINDFTAVSLFITFGLPLFLFGLLFGLYHWIANVAANVDTPVGTVMLAVLALFFGFELLLQALVLDVANVPRRPLQERYRDD